MQDEGPVVVRIAAVAGLRGLDDVVDLAGGHVVQDVALAVVVPVLEVAEHGIDLRPEHDAGLGFRRAVGVDLDEAPRSEEHTSELQSLMRNSYTVLCLKTQKYTNKTITHRKITE